MSVIVSPSERKKSLALNCLGAVPRAWISDMEAGDFSSPKYPWWNWKASG